jgi:hypothetical protein
LKILLNILILKWIEMGSLNFAEFGSHGFKPSDYGIGVCLILDKHINSQTFERVEGVEFPRF